MNKRKAKAFIDSELIEIEGNTPVKNPTEIKKQALKNLKDKIMNQLVKTVSERAVASEKANDKEETEKLIKKANRLKKSRKD